MQRDVPAVIFGKKPLITNALDRNNMVAISPNPDSLFRPNVN
jgi:hypothetical protein